MPDERSAQARGREILSRERWELLRQEAPARALARIAADELPASLAARVPRGARFGPWSLHQDVWGPRGDDRPGSLIWARAEFSNGRSASVVYGCQRSFFESWQLTLAGPWALEISMAARVGDEARGEMCACFELGAEPPSPARFPSSFDEDSWDWTGSATALVETRSAESAARALSMLASLGSAWDDPDQPRLWALAREGPPGALAAALARAPGWERRAWSKGSSLLALCLRLGRWGSAAEVARACGPEALAELAPEASRALAALCRDVSPTWPAARAPEAIGRAWICGARLCPLSFCEALGEGAELREAGRRAWRQAEARALRESCRAGSGSGSRRL